MKPINSNPRDAIWDQFSSVGAQAEPLSYGRYKPSLSYDDAGKQIARGDCSWNGVGVIGKGAVLTYGFQNAYSANMPDNVSGFRALNAGQQWSVREALATWSDVANLSFREKQLGYGSDANLKFGGFSYSYDQSYAFAFFPKPAGGPHGGEAWFDLSSSTMQNDYDVYGYGRTTFVHEIGHALGLNHPGDYNAGSGRSFSYSNSAEYAQDTYTYSIMSYFSEHNTGDEFYGAYPAGPMLHDISAIQHLYGANMNTRIGDTTYGFNSNADRAYFKATQANSPLVFSVWDAGGYNTFDFSGYKSNQHIDLRQGHFSDVGGAKGNVSIAMGTHIQHAIGGMGNDVIIGNSEKDVLEGNRGDNILIGGPKGDILVGGSGHNKYCYFGTQDSTLNDPDQIRGFKSGIDKIDLSGLAQSHIFQVSAHVQHLGASWDDVLISVNGSNHPDMEIKVMGHVTEGDFLYGNLAHDTAHIG